MERIPYTCPHCKTFFTKYQCSKYLGECDCPKCQGICTCQEIVIYTAKEILDMKFEKED